MSGKKVLFREKKVLFREKKVLFREKKVLFREKIFYFDICRDSSVGTTRYGLDGPGIESRRGEIFRTSPEWPWNPHNLLYNGYRLCIPGVKRPGHGVNHPPLLAPRLKKRLELYLCFLHWTCSASTFHVLFRVFPSTGCPFSAAPFSIPNTI